MPYNTVRFTETDKAIGQTDCNCTLSMIYDIQYELIVFQKLLKGRRFCPFPVFVVSTSPRSRTSVERMSIDRSHEGMPVDWFSGPDPREMK
jgi:hypothetical protein